MTETFTASNGITIKQREPDDGFQVWDIGSNLGVLFAEDEWDALREFFRDEEDRRLGRWRWPENPDYVVYHARNANGDHKVLNLADGHGMLWGRDMEPAPQSSDTVESAARAYFDAHPEPKPWHDAKPGEVWLVTVDGEERALLVDPEQFTDGNEGIDFDDGAITDARRIWPEVS